MRKNGHSLKKKTYFQIFIMFDVLSEKKCCTKKNEEDHRHFEIVVSKNDHGSARVL